MLQFSKTYCDRRRFLRSSSALAIAGLFPVLSSGASQTTAGDPAEDSGLNLIPRDTLLKFNNDGSPRPFAGNTVICHLAQQSRMSDSITAVGSALRASSFASKLAILPAGSYHMTILGGPNDQDRGRYGWPSDVPVDASIAECNRVIGERIASFKTRTDLPLVFRLDAEKTLAPQRPCGLQLAPADAGEQQKIRRLRDRLADEVFHFRADNHDTFGFHISIAYQVGSLSSGEQREYHSILEKHVAAIIATGPEIEFGVPEFTTFEDMYRFEVHRLLHS